MSLALVAPEIVVPIAATAGAVRGIIGEKRYESTRHDITWRMAAIESFLPINPVIIPFQIGLFVMFLLMLIYVFGMTWSYAIPTAYIGESIFIMIAFQWIMDKFLRYGFGI